MLAWLAEYDVRKLYVRAGYPSMYEYCVAAKHFSENGARKRIHAARAAREFPALFVALAEGKLHLTSVVMLAPHLRPDNVHDLIARAAHRTAAQIEQLLGERVLGLETLNEGASISVSTPPAARVTGPALIDPERAARRVEPETMPAGQRPSQVTLVAQTTAPVAPQATPAPRPGVWVALEAQAHEKLEYARALLSHRMPLGSASQVLERALDDLIAKEEKSKFAATDRPRRVRDRSSRARHIPAHVKRAVWKRDGGRCTFVGTDGHRCGSRKYLEYDHIDPVARGGEATVDRMRLRCRAHNQYEAERAFGAEFMRRKREEARTKRNAVESRAVPDQGGGDAGMGLGSGRLHGGSDGLRPGSLEAQEWNGP
jgi:5-methylcytosine-specific restriction endonuclease McrA